MSRASYVYIIINEDASIEDERIVAGFTVKYECINFLLGNDGHDDFQGWQVWRSKDYPDSPYECVFLDMAKDLIVDEVYV
jgi:hypothetical protein